MNKKNNLLKGHRTRILVHIFSALNETFVTNQQLVPLVVIRNNV